MRIPWTVVGPLLAALVGGGCGGGPHHSTNAGSVTRAVDVEMRDVAYSPTEIAVRAGETVRFVFHNKGESVHDAFLGDEAAQAEHEQEMRGGHGMDGGHHGANDAVTVEPGKSGSLTHAFDRAGSLIIGCHEPGHYQAGMKLTLTVS